MGLAVDSVVAAGDSVVPGRPPHLGTLRVAQDPGGYIVVMTDERVISKDLEKIEQTIQKARQAAEDAGILDDPDEPKFYEPGEVHPEPDDQTIAPG